jgi:hypothetical protein
MHESSVNPAQISKTATNSRGLKVGILSKNIQHIVYHSTDRKQIFLYVKFEVRLSILFKRASKSNKKWHFSWMKLPPFFRPRSLNNRRQHFFVDLSWEESNSHLLPTLPFMRLMASLAATHLTLSWTSTYGMLRVVTIECTLMCTGLSFQWLESKVCKARWISLQVNITTDWLEKGSLGNGGLALGRSHKVSVL